MTTAVASKNSLLNNQLDDMTKGGLYFDQFLADAFKTSLNNVAALRSAFAANYVTLKKQDPAQPIDRKELYKTSSAYFQYPGNDDIFLEAYTSVLIGAAKDKDAGNDATHMQNGLVYFDTYLSEAHKHAGEKPAALRGSFAGRYAALKAQGSTAINYSTERAQTAKHYVYSGNNSTLVDSHTKVLISAASETHFCADISDKVPAVSMPEAASIVMNVKFADTHNNRKLKLGTFLLAAGCFVMGIGIGKLLPRNKDDISKKQKIENVSPIAPKADSLKLNN